MVYTPVEVIDFIIHSTQHLLKRHFDIGFADRSVKVMDPFAGTGTFITRLLESGLFAGNLYEKYKYDLYANELILLAYYVAAVNIETTYSSLRRGGRYVPFGGINYTDTLSLNARYREDERHRKEATKIDKVFQEAHMRIRHQRGAHIHVLVGNPPYSKGQSKYDDDNPNVKYDVLDQRIINTYFQKATTHDKKSLYDSYVRALRWASDRIGESGIISFVTNASFIRSETASGIRASLAEEFNEVWCFDLRGNQRTQGDVSKKEGGKIFGSGSRAPVAITILVKNPKKKGCMIRYHDIGDYHTREEKLEMIKDAKSIQGIKDWQTIKPDKHYDWLDQRGDEFSKYTVIGSKEVKSGNSNNAIFKMYSLGIATHRDVWVYNSIKKELSDTMKSCVSYCRTQKDVTPNPQRIQLDSTLKNKISRTKPHFSKEKIRISLYRPFFKQFLYFDDVWISAPYQIPKFFPEGDSKTPVIVIPDKGKKGEFSTLITNITPDLHLIEQSQAFPYMSIRTSTRERERERVENLVIIVPYKYTGEPSVIITDTTPDLEVIHHGQCFPFLYYREGRLRREYIGFYATGV